MLVHTCIKNLFTYLPIFSYRSILSMILFVLLQQNNLGYESLDFGVSLHIFPM